MFVVSTRGSDKSVTFASRKVAVAQARMFSAKYRRTFTVSEVFVPFNTPSMLSIYAQEGAELVKLSEEQIANI